MYFCIGLGKCPKAGHEVHWTARSYRMMFSGSKNSNNNSNWWHSLRKHNSNSNSNATAFDRLTGVSFTFNYISSVLRKVNSSLSSNVTYLNDALSWLKVLVWVQVGIWICTWLSTYYARCGQRASSFYLIICMRSPVQPATGHRLSTVPYPLSGYKCYE